MQPPRRRLVSALAVLLVITLAAAGAYAQRGFREGSFATRYAPAAMPDAAFVICRLAYTQVRREESGIGWQTDYPYAEINLMTRLSELTKTRVSRDTNGDPNYYVVRSEEHTSELQSQSNLVCRLLLEKKKKKKKKKRNRKTIN